MTPPIRALLRVAVVMAATSAIVLLIVGPYTMNASDTEMPWVILATSWAALYLTKPRRN